MLAILAFEVTIYRHQEYYRGRNNLTAPVSKTIFHDITRLHLDDGIINCAKYFINYFFYKFGLEVSCLVWYCCSISVKMLLAALGQWASGTSLHAPWYLASDKQDFLLWDNCPMWTFSNTRSQDLYFTAVNLALWDLWPYKCVYIIYHCI